MVDLVGATARTWPVGRLDIDSEGLVVVTNDGVLTNLITHPRYGITKTYVALVDAELDDAAVSALEAGVELDDGPAAAISARVLDVNSGRSLVEIVMGEGRNREVRRMCSAVGAEVLTLVRTAIGPVRDGRLRAGEHRKLEPAEVTALYAAADMDAIEDV